MLFFGCEEPHTDHPVFKFYPSSAVFEEGYATKYYYHYYPDNPDSRAGTEIGYTKYVKLSSTLFKTESYDAAYRLTGRRTYLVQGDSVALQDAIAIRNVTDTSELNILNHTISAWNSELSRPHQILYTFNDKQYLYKEYQTSVIDTLIDDRSAKAFTSEWTYAQADTDSVVNQGTSKSYYIEGYGYFGSRNKGSDYTRHVEVVEQMSASEFDRRANHGEHRVAWIDPGNTMSDDSDFQICGHELSIADYYWSSPDAGYFYGKRAMLDTIYSSLDDSKLFNQDGRLVFRFVVNCNGEPGRFIVRGYDLDYRPMEFRQETVDHLFSIMQKLEKWKPVLFGEELQDAYFYITFNIEDGEITNILP